MLTTAPAQVRIVLAAVEAVTGSGYLDVASARGDPVRDLVRHDVLPTSPAP